MSSLAKLPSANDSTVARAAVRALQTLNLRDKLPQIGIRPEGSPHEMTVSIPKEAYSLFLEILGQMANGNAVTIVPTNAELTTQEAADILNVSRPHLVTLLESGKLPFRLVGTHRRIKAADVFEYQSQEAKEGREILDGVAAEAQKHGLGY